MPFFSWLILWSPGVIDPKNKKEWEKGRDLGKRRIKELAVKESVTHCDSVTASAGDTLQQKKENLRLHTNAILLWWIGMRVSLQSFGGKKKPELKM